MDTIFTQDFWNSTTDAQGNVFTEDASSGGSWLDNLTNIFQSGLGAFGAWSTQQAANDRAALQLAAQRQQTAAAANFQANLTRWLPLIIVGLVGAVALTIVLRRK